MKMRVFAIAALLIPTVCSAQVDLAAARRQHAASVEKARAVVMAKYHEKLVELSLAERAAEYGQVETYANLFETRGLIGILPAARDMTTTFSTYGREIKDAADEIRDAYGLEIKRLTAAGDTRAAADLASDLSMMRLPGKLVSLQHSPTRIFLRHRGGAMFAKQRPDSSTLKLTAIFQLEPGLSDPNYAAIRSGNRPDSYIRHSNYRVIIQQTQDSDAWRGHATWIQVPGLSDADNGVSFKAATHPERYMRVRDNGEVWIDPFVEHAKFRKEATFYVRPALYKLWE